MRGKPSHVTDEELVRMHIEEELTLTEVGSRVGLSRERVRQRVRRAGVLPEVTHRIRSPTALWVCDGCGKREERIKREMARLFCSRKCAGEHHPSKYTDGGLLEALRVLAEEIGYTPGVKDLMEHSPPAHSMYYRRFGSLRAAQKLAGLEPNAQGGGGHRRER